MQYSYVKKVNLEKLTAAIRASAITVAFDYMVNEADNDLFIFFKGELSEAEETILDGLVSDHVYTANQAQTTKVEVDSIPAFAAKFIEVSPGVIKKLFKRVHGLRQQMTAPAENAEYSENTLEFTSPYPWVKFLGLHFIGGEVGDYVDLTVHDTVTGFYFNLGSKLQLNKFGFEANIAPNFFEAKSEFDADLYGGMIIRIKYYSKSEKKIGVNYIMNEVKD